MSTYSILDGDGGWCKVLKTMSFTACLLASTVVNDPNCAKPEMLSDMSLLYRNKELSAVLRPAVQVSSMMVSEGEEEEEEEEVKGAIISDGQGDGGGDVLAEATPSPEIRNDANV